MKDNARVMRIVTYTAMAAAVFGVGLLLLTLDMRTAGAPAEQIFLADVATYSVLAVAVLTGVPALASWITRMRDERGDHEI